VGKQKACGQQETVRQGFGPGMSRPKSKRKQIAALGRRREKGEGDRGAGGNRGSVTLHADWQPPLVSVHERFNPANVCPLLLGRSSWKPSHVYPSASLGGGAAKVQSSPVQSISAQFSSVQFSPVQLKRPSIWERLSCYERFRNGAASR